MRARLIFAAALLTLVSFLLGRLAPPSPLVRVYVGVPRASWAYEWAGHLHVFDKHQYRRVNGRWPVKSGTRVVALGDSYTYGYGVAAEDAWPAQLASLTGLEVLNLGVPGDQSDAIAPRMQALWCDGLQPDVVVYAVCENDLWPQTAYHGWEAMAESPIGAVRWAARRIDWFDFNMRVLGNPERFRADVARMAATAREHAVPLIVAVYDNQGRVAWRDLAEREVEAAGARLVRFRLPPGEWRVSRWEGHPNAEAHRRFAEAIAGVLP